MNCIRLDQEVRIHEFYGILVECSHKGKKAIIPLADIGVNEEHANFSLIELYQDWFWSYR
ncbi:hypothetical protein ACFQ3N_02620 [Virgibacillus byunsanensis]|uniref:Uncharacterized protein n=1 Tax=Virgibacillus byunsanensis TaxID=570945 RepID=A0ABW3LIP2_9BACI